MITQLNNNKKNNNTARNVLASNSFRKNRRRRILNRAVRQLLEILPLRCCFSP